MPLKCWKGLGYKLGWINFFDGYWMCCEFRNTVTGTCTNENSEYNPLASISHLYTSIFSIPYVFYVCDVCEISSLTCQRLWELNLPICIRGSSFCNHISRVYTS